MIKLGFSRKITLCACSIVVLALIVFSIINYLRMRSDAQHSLEQGLSEISRGAAANIANWLNGKLAITEAVASKIMRFADGKPKVELLSAANKAGMFKNLYMGDESGKFIIDETSSEIPEGFDPRARPWYQLAKNERVVSFTEPYLDAFSKEMLISSVAPVSAAQFVGVVGGDLSLKAISDIINQIKFMGLGHAFLVTGQGKVIVHPQKENSNKQLQEVYGSRKLDIAPNIQSVVVAGEEKLVTFYPVQGVPDVEWYVAVEIDEAKAFAGINGFRNMAVLVTIAGAVLTVLILSLLLGKLTRPLHVLERALDEVARGGGDLTKRLEEGLDDEIGRLARSFNIFIEHIHMLIEDFKGSSENLALMVNDMAQISAKSRHEVERQKQETEMVATAVSEMSSAAHEIAQNANEAALAANDADREGVKTRSVVNDAIASIQSLVEEVNQASGVIKELEKDVTSISSVLDVIRGIAEQTNLLALNAAIEAARAGEQGRGFAVVADEVRTLASKTQESTEEINQMIERLQRGSQRAVAVMSDSQIAGTATLEKADEAGSSLGIIATAVSTISDMNTQIAAASEEQTAVTEDITRSVTTIADATEITAEAARDTAKTSETLAEIGRSIQEKVNRFKV